LRFNDTVVEGMGFVANQNSKLRKRMSVSRVTCREEVARLYFQIGFQTNAHLALQSSF
jgi:hypothetical protein